MLGVVPNHCGSGGGVIHIFIRISSADNHAEHYASTCHDTGAHASTYSLAHPVAKLHDGGSADACANNTST